MKSESIGYSQTQINVITEKHSCVVSFQVQYSQHMVSQVPGQSSQRSGQQVGHSSQPAPGGGDPPLGDPQASQQVIDLLIE